MAEFIFGPGIPRVIGAIILVATAIPMWRMWNVYSGASTRRPFDASAAGLQPPPELVDTVSRLIRLGFQRLGEAQLDLPGMAAATVTATNDPRAAGVSNRHTVFVFVDQERTVVAETGVVPHAPILVSFNSLFADGSVVETMYPRGESIHDADFHSGHSSQSLDRAYDDQRVEISRWRMRHGSPRQVQTMADFLRADAEYRERYARRKLRRPFIRNQLLPAVLIVVGVVAFVVWLTLPT
jgi:hypothetical protein